jgi:multiple sugar transport system substrate-binding protein
MIAQNKASIPGNNDLDAVAQWAAWLQGKVAMIFSWPPTGRMSSNYSQRDKAINFIPQSSIADKVGYAVVPGGNGEMASGYVRALAAGSNNEEAAYLFMQWVTAPPLSLVRTMLPYTLRDPYRLSTYKSAEYRALWPAANEYLINLCECANSGVVDIIMPGAQDYALSSTGCARRYGAGRIRRRPCRRPPPSGMRPPSASAYRRKRRPIRSSSRYRAAMPTTRSRRSVRRCI